MLNSLVAACGEGVALATAKKLTYSKAIVTSPTSIDDKLQAVADPHFLYSQDCHSRSMYFPLYLLAVEEAVANATVDLICLMLLPLFDIKTVKRHDSSCS